MWTVLLVIGNEAEALTVKQALDSPERQCRIALNISEALKALDEEIFAMLVMDFDFFGDRIEALLANLAQRGEQTPLLMISSRPEDLVSDRLADSENWIWISRPISQRQLKIAADRFLESVRGPQSLDYLHHKEGYIHDFDDIIGGSNAIKQVLELVRKVAASNSSVLITGESGTGKELIAAAIHYNSPRRKENFVAVNCAALHENLLESELFGHEKGAFTGAYRRRIGRFEQANGGTLFLDEIGDMSMATQAKVLRVIQLQEFERLGGLQKVRVNVRIIAATNKNLKAAIASGAFREDLFYRLNVIPLHVPPLRERPEDIMPLADHFVEKFTGTLGRKGIKLSADAVDQLKVYRWPGNIRELENVIERAVLVSGDDLIKPSDMLLDMQAIPRQAPEAAEAPPQPERIESRNGEAAAEDEVAIPDAGIDLEQVERDYIVAALRKAHGVQKEAARLLGITPRVMHYKIKKHNISEQEYR